MKKFRSNYRDTKYHVILEKDRTGLFDSMTSIFLASFAIGFHNNLRKSVSGGTNHVNLSSIGSEHHDLMILLVHDRHPEIDAYPIKVDVDSDDSGSSEKTRAMELWSIVEEYAEGGIEELYESLFLSEWVLDVDSLN